MISIIDLTLSLLGVVVAQTTKNNLPAEIISGVQTAIAALEKVRGTPVTQQQLESFRFTPKW
jgi:hypothetical protein